MKPILNFAIITLLLVFSACNDNNNEDSNKSIIKKINDEAVTLNGLLQENEENGVIIKVINEYIRRPANKEFPKIPGTQHFLLNAFTTVLTTQAAWDSERFSLILPQSNHFRTKKISLNKEVYTWTTVQGDSIKAILTETPDQYNFEYILEKSKPGITLGTFRKGFISKTIDGVLLELTTYTGGEQVFLIRRSIDGNKKIYYLKNDERISIVTYTSTNGGLEIYNDIKLVEKYSWTENGVKGNYNNFETGQSEVW